MQHLLASVLLPGYRRQVLGLLLLHPDDALHGREIARRTGLPPGTLTRELNRLAASGLLKREKRGNQVLYSADRSCPVFEEVASMLRKTSGMADVIRDALSPVADRILAACVFGSVARGAETSGSDVDVLIVGDVSLGAVVDVFFPIQTRIGREINPKVFSQREWRAKVKAKDVFATEILRKPKMFLIGDRDELAETGRGHARKN